MDKTEVLAELKKRFPKMEINEEQTRITAYDKDINIDIIWKTGEIYLGVDVGKELLNMITENIIWNKISKENGLSFNNDSDIHKILALTEIEFEKLENEGLLK